MTAARTADALSAFGDVARLADLIERLGRQSSDYHDRHVERRAAETAAEVIERWASVSTTSKAELLIDQDDRPPYGTRLLVPREGLHLVVESSGSTSGTKEIHALSGPDEATVTAMMAAAFGRIGLGAADSVAVTLPISTAGGGAKVYHTLRAVGALALRIGSISTEEKVAEILRFRPTGIVATPSYLDRLAAVIRSTGNRPDALGVTTVLVATQAVSVDWVRRTQATWQADVYEWYGNASGFFAMTCSEGVVSADGNWGTLHWDPQFQLLEVIDESGGPVVHGQAGELVGTHLSNSTSPLIRYRLGDEAEYVAPGRCGCGSALPGLRAGSIRRADGMVKFRGVSLWPTAVDRALEQLAGIDSFWVVLRHDADSAEVAELFIRPSAVPFDYDRVAAEVRQATGVRFSVTGWEDDEPPPACRVVSASGKSPRWVDLRQHGESETTNKEISE